MRLITRKIRYYSHFIQIERNFEIRYRRAKGHAEEKMVERSKGSSERLTKLSVKKVDEQARVKDSWQIVCLCGQTVKLNYEYNLGRFREHRMHSRKCYTILYEIEAFQSNWYSNLYEISRIEAYEMDLYYSIFA